MNIYICAVHIFIRFLSYSYFLHMGESHLEQRIFMFVLQAVWYRKEVLVSCKARVTVMK